jgi:hypothetical protein
MLGTPKGPVALRDFCKSESVNEVYVSVSADSAASEDGHLAELVALLYRSDIRVEALFSSTDADELGKHRNPLLARAQ